MEILMDWFRFHVSALDKKKIQGLPPPLFKAWINAMCVASEFDNENGTLPSADNFCFRVRINPVTGMKQLNELVKRNLIDRDGKLLKMHDWRDWQFRSDSSTERVRKHRQKQQVKQSDETPRNVSVTPYIRSDQIRSETEQTQSACETFRFEEFWEQYPNKIGKDRACRMWISRVTPENVEPVFAGLKRWQQSERWQRGIYHDPANWLNETCWEDSPPKTTDDDEDDF